MRTFCLLLCLISFDKLVTAQTSIIVTNQEINIPGSIAVGVWQNNNNNKSFPDYPKMHYAFAAGDEIAIDFTTKNGKGTQRMSVTEYESGSVAYSNNAFQTLTDIRIKVPKTGIYKFEFATNHVFDRQCNVMIRRIPGINAPGNFNYNVNWKIISDTVFNKREEAVKVKTTYETISLQTPINHYINSVTNLTGKTRISFPIILPENTVEWYYTFAATRNKADVDKTKQKMKLMADLSKIISLTGALPLGISMLTEPPGANYCDVYLISQETNQAFLEKKPFREYAEATRENLMSGVVKIKDCCKVGRYFIGMRNNDLTYGIEVMIEVVAIVQSDVYETRIVKRPMSVTQHKEPYMLN
ncbi:hypothetical protein [Sediminibacterium ginsengisoli]|uniref:Uncharacterized protein n=1 Tax=Sediminibacterium ginsengisoli TaxID=413434 RepID=A0A1T4QB26_9BACT|nr:hypothetical protein [Sediminibacterium ginsengisoli]SKA00990.1 hypothetical protein SAMN04488132_10822 [Sediminibacterium ginsengisoli]